MAGNLADSRNAALEEAYKHLGEETSHEGVDVFVLKCGEQRPVKGRSTSTTASIRMTVHADFDRCVVRRLGTPWTAARVAETTVLVVRRDEQPMWPRVVVRIEPCPTLGGDECVKIECDCGVNDIVIVDVGQCR